MFGRRDPNEGKSARLLAAEQSGNPDRIVREQIRASNKKGKK
jgi:hypothetical protein